MADIHQFSEVALKFANSILKYTAPILSVKSHSSNLPPAVDSSVVFIEIDNRFFGITAAHSMYAKLDHLGIQIDLDFLSLGGEIKVFETNDMVNYDPSKLDLAVWELSDEMVVAVRKKYSFLPWAKVAVDHPAVPLAPYMIVGFPAEKTTKHFPTKTVSLKPLVLCSIGVNYAFYLEEELEPFKTLALVANQQMVGSFGSQNILSLPDLGGISGCGIWHIKNLTGTKQEFELVGILTGENNEQTVLFGSRVNYLRKILIYQFGISNI